MNKISVIVPAYNVEKYIFKCLESISKQTYKEFEVIIVNDGSLDSTLSICEKFVSQDNRFTVCTKKNGGLSSARNFGIEKSSGDFILFIDSDDYIDENMLEILLANLINNSADVSIAKILDCYGTINKITDPIVTESYIGEAALKESLIAKKFSIHAVAKLFKKEILKNIRFKEGITSEDALFMINVFLRTKNVVYTNACVYYYLHRAGSISTSSFNEKTLDVIKVWEENYIKIIAAYPELSELAHMRVVWAYFTALDRSILYLNFSDKRILNMVSYLKKQMVFTLKNKYFNKVRKISVLVLSFSIKRYRNIVELHNKKINKLFD